MIFIEAILAPAVLISAAGLLVMGTGNRYGRIVDRVRIANQELLNTDERDRSSLIILRDLFARRARYAWLALIFLHSGILCFVVASLLLGLGTNYTNANISYAGQGMMFLGVSLLGCASLNMVREAQGTFETTRQDIARTETILKGKDRG